MAEQLETTSVDVELAGDDLWAWTRRLRAERDHLRTGLVDIARKTHAQGCNETGCTDGHHTWTCPMRTWQEAVLVLTMARGA